MWLHAVHHALAFYHWLVLNNLWKSVISTVVGSVLGGVLGFYVGRLMLRAPWEAHRKAQESVSDKLSTDTPGGLHDILLELQRQRGVLEELMRRLDGGQGSGPDNSGKAESTACPGPDAEEHGKASRAPGGSGRGKSRK